MHFKNFQDYLRAVKGKIEPLHAEEFDLTPKKKKKEKKAHESKTERPDPLPEDSELPSSK